MKWLRNRRLTRSAAFLEKNGYVVYFDKRVRRRTAAQIRAQQKAANKKDKH